MFFGAPPIQKNALEKIYIERGGGNVEN